MGATDAVSHEVISPLTAWAYRHQARRLRHHFRHDPVGLHLSLRALAVRANRESRALASPERTVRQSFAASPPNAPAEASPPPTVASTIHSTSSREAAILQTSPDAVEQFSLMVRTMLGEGVLRYSRRQALMKQAKKLGIKPFEASLLIATVEHRLRNEPAGSSYVLRPPRRWSVLIGVAALLALEVAAVGALAVILL